MGRVQVMSMTRLVANLAALFYFQSIFIGGIDAHAPGEEYTYLRMFLKGPDTLQQDEEIFETQSFANAPGIRRWSAQGMRVGGRSLHSDDAEHDVRGDEDAVKPEYMSARPGRKVLSHPASQKEESRPNVKLELPKDINHEGAESKDEISMELGTRKNPHVNEPIMGDSADGRESKERGTSTSVMTPSLKSFSGVGGVKNGEDIKRVSYMLLRIIKQYKARSMVDVPCRAHASWMHLLMRQVENDIPDFKYYCVDPSKHVLKAVQNQMKTFSNGKYVLKQFWKEALPEADIVFSWGGLETMKKENVNMFLKLVATSKNHKYFLVGSHSADSIITSKTNDGPKSLARALNLRQAPFSLNRPMRVISDLSTKGLKKQMYLFKPEKMRGDWS
jgi:hypothetical protein